MGITWRHFPIDILTNENMQWIEAQLPRELATAPYMFYIVALKNADDYGIFDLEDGVIFSKLMRVGTVRDLIKIANLMQQRKIITRVSAESNKCFINNWETPKNIPSRTMAQRRQLVLDQIEEAKKQNKSVSSKFTLDDMNETNHIIPIVEETSVSVDFAQNPAAKNFYPENDKNAEIVVKEKMDDKNVENVDEKKIHTDRQTNIQTNNTDLNNTNTHTQAVDFHALAQGALQSAAERPAVAEIETTEVQAEQNATETQQSLVAAPDCNAPNEDALYGTEDQEEIDSQVLCQMQDFFVKNCYGYKKNAGVKPLSEIVCRINALSDEINPPEIIASVMLQEFKKLTKQPGYFQGLPLLPAYMKKARIWAQLLQNAGKILCGNAAVKMKFSQQAEIYSQESESERDQVYDLIQSQYLKYGIDPQDPNRVIKLHQAQKKAEEHSEE